MSAGFRARCWRRDRDDGGPRGWFRLLRFSGAAAPGADTFTGVRPRSDAPAHSVRRCVSSSDPSDVGRGKQKTEAHDYGRPKDSNGGSIGVHQA